MRAPRGQEAQAPRVAEDALGQASVASTAASREGRAAEEAAGGRAPAPG